MAKKTKEQVRAEVRREQLRALQQSKPSTKPLVFVNDPFNKELAGFELQEK